jgi:O-antigen/teichoic acid export membrane protein
MSFALPNATSLKARVFRAGGWLLLAHGCSQVLRLVSSLVMTRLLAPELFGIMAIAGAVQIMITLLSDIGLHQAVIQSPRGAERSFLETAWTLQILRGVFIWLACAIFGACLWCANSVGWIGEGSVYGDTRLPVVIVVTSLTSIILGFQSMKAVTHNRDLEMKYLTLIEIGSAVVSISSGIVVGYLTHSIWSFVAGALLSALTVTVLSHTWLSGVRDHLRWESAALAELRRFGKWVFLSSAATAFGMNGDRVLLGLWVSPATLGTYSIAANLATLVEGIGNRFFTNLSFPALSETARRDPSRFASVYFRMRWFSDAGFVWMAGFLFSAGELIVSIMYDPRYAAAGEMLKWLSFSLLFNRYNLVGSAYLAMGKPNYTAALNYARLVSLFVMVPALFYAYGIYGAVIGIAFHKCPVQLLIFLFNRRYQLNNALLEVASLGFWSLGYGSGMLALYAANVWHYL